jgi:hypothetical protein
MIFHSSPHEESHFKYRNVRQPLAFNILTVRKRELVNRITKQGLSGSSGEHKNEPLTTYN